MKVRIFQDKVTLAQEAAAWCVGILNDVIRGQGNARLILATGCSQFEFLDELRKLSVPWDKVTCFHLDEYVGISDEHPASFRKYLKDRIWNSVSPGFAAVHMLDPKNIEEYSKLLMGGNIDLACIGIGENGHIAFNDPPVADFEDPEWVKVVELDEACRMQQVGEGWFSDLSSTPTHAVTLTIPSIMRANALSIVVPDQRKAKATKDAIEGPLSTACPASVLRNHDNAVLWLDEEAASLLTKPLQFSTTLSFPGFVDIQVNGYLGVDFSSSSLTTTDCHRAFNGLLSNEGYAIFLPTVITCSMETYRHVLPILADTIDRFTQHVPGIHLEGPFISSVEGYRGMHPESHIRSPCVDLLKELCLLARHRVKMITIAAELPGADEVCKHATSKSIVVSLGHQAATPKDLNLLFRAGATSLTHLGNAIPQTVHRHDNPILVGLGQTELKVCMIGDGYHLPDHVIAAALKCCGNEDVMFASDMAPMCGMRSGAYKFGGVDVTLDPSGRLSMSQYPECLAGSGSSLLRAVNYLLIQKLIDVSDIERLGWRNPLKLLCINETDVKSMKCKLEYYQGRIQLIS